VEAYGKNALRDAAVWGYGTFAILMAARIAAHPVTVSRLADRFATFARVFLLVVPVIWLLSAAFGVIVLIVRGQIVPFLKGGDLLVHLAGVIAFIYLKVRDMPTAWLIVAPLVFAVAATNRGGLLSLGIAVTVLFLLHRRTHRVIVVTAAFATMLTAAVTFDVRFKLPDRDKELSPSAVIERFKSIFVDTSQVQYEATERWRLRWWEKIARYTFSGPYFWTGKGFGPNVAYSDGFVSQPSAPLRSPHSAHFTFLARGGIPGLALWLLVQGVWGVAMARRWRACRLVGNERLAAIFLFLIVYWAALLTNASFDVFVEGPMGGIWFWSAYGAGVGLMSAYDRMLMAARCFAAGDELYASGTAAPKLAGNIPGGVLLGTRR